MEQSTKIEASEVIWHVATKFDIHKEESIPEVVNMAEEKLEVGAVTLWKNC